MCVPCNPPSDSQTHPKRHPVLLLPSLSFVPLDGAHMPPLVRWPQACPPPLLCVPCFSSNKIDRPAMIGQSKRPNRHPLLLLIDSTRRLGNGPSPRFSLFLFPLAPSIPSASHHLYSSCSSFCSLPSFSMLHSFVRSFVFVVDKTSVHPALKSPKPRETGGARRIGQARWRRRASTSCCKTQPKPNQGTHAIHGQRWGRRQASI